MKKKGFTLIELLAVIVILAIIALIATPIILNIISDSKEESNKRSVELYGKAVANAVAQYQLNNNGSISGTFTASEDGKLLTLEGETEPKLTIEYNGNVVCTTVNINETGKVTLAGCIVNGSTSTYKYGANGVEKEEIQTPDNGETPDSGSTQVYKPQYYYFGKDWNGTVGTTAAPSNPSSVPPTGEIRYLGYDVTDGKVSAAYSCFVRNDVEYCLKGYDTEAFTTNTEIIKDAYADVVDTNACSFDDAHSNCGADGLSVRASSDGTVAANGGGVTCGVHGGGDFGCGEY